jgi:hypothetical protein
MPARKTDMAGMCDCSHHRWLAWIILIVGVLYLLQDTGVITWFGWLNWWTALFIVLGLGAVCKCCDRMF